MTKRTHLQSQRLKNDNESIRSELLEVRQYAIGLTVATERLLESLGHPVESAIITRQQRRLTRNNHKRKI